MTCILDEGWLYIDPTFGDIASFFFAISANIAFFGNIFCRCFMATFTKIKVQQNSDIAGLQLCGINNIPAVIYMIHHGHTQVNIPCWYRTLVGVVTLTSTSSSAYSIVLLTYDRYVLITKPSQYNEMLSKCKVNFIIIFFWVTGLVGAITGVFYQPFYIVSYAIFFIWTTVALIASYFLIWRAVRKSQRRIAATNITRDTHRQNVRLAKKVSIIVICYLVAFIPTFIYILFSLGFHAFSNRAKSSLYLFSLYTVFSNSAVNPFLYAWKDPEFKASCKRLLKKNKVTALLVKGSS